MQTICNGHSPNANCTVNHNAKWNPKNNPINNPKNSRRNRAASKLFPVLYSSYKRLRKYHSSNFSEKLWIQAGGTQQQVDEIDAFKLAVLLEKAGDTQQSDNQAAVAIAAPIVVLPKISEQDRERYRRLTDTRVKQSKDVVSQVRNRSTKPRQKQNIWLTDNEALLAMIANEWKCAFCDHQYESYTLDGSVEWCMVKPEQMHVTKTKNQGGKKEDVFMGCSVCNRIHGQGEGMSADALKAIIKREHNYLNVPNVGPVKVVSESIQ
jgi:hypothetical protein